MVFAVATLDSIIIYDTENFYHIIYVDDIHYAEITDMSWYKIHKNCVKKFIIFFKDIGWQDIGCCFKRWLLYFN